jgi:hypothetical protein
MPYRREGLDSLATTRSRQANGHTRPRRCVVLGLASSHATMVCCRDTTHHEKASIFWVVGLLRPPLQSCSCASRIGGVVSCLQTPLRDQLFRVLFQNLSEEVIDWDEIDRLLRIFNLTSPPGISICPDCRFVVLRVRRHPLLDHVKLPVFLGRSEPASVMSRGLS